MIDGAMLVAAPRQRGVGLQFVGADGRALFDVGEDMRLQGRATDVLNNARQMAAAADQYYLENGATFADSNSLVGATNYVKALNTVASEVYPSGYTQGVTITITGVANARTITYAP